MKKIWIFIFGCVLLASCTQKTGEEEKQLPLLKVSENHRFLETEDGQPFFWLGDTGWLLFARLNRVEADKYLTNRAEKGFNVIQVMVLHSLNVTNVYGDSALVNRDIANPNATEGSHYENNSEYDYWDHMDYIIDLAAKKGLYMALVPVWGSNVKSGKISREQAGKYSTWLAKRYAGKHNIIWLIGGDTMGNDSTATWNIIGQNLKKVSPGQLVTFHPIGRKQSSLWFHDAEWLDFNMFQSGHRRYDQDDSEKGYGQDNWKYARDDYSLTPVKPTLDGEPSYEGIPQGLHDPNEPFWNDADVRRYAYWSVFAGGFGFTYGNNAIMQFHKPGAKNPAYGVREYWTEAIDMPGAGQMIYLKNLMHSKPFFERVPDDNLVVNQGEKYDHIAATRGTKYALFYTYNGRDMAVNAEKIQGEKVLAKWFNPRNGEQTEIGTFENRGVLNFDPPGEKADGNDWVLVLDSNM